jgi:NAD(P)H-flavin reductase
MGLSFSESRPSRVNAWTGHTGHITRAIIDEFTGKYMKESHIFVCGPVPMINAVIRELREAGVDRRRIHDERFTM